MHAYHKTKASLSVPQGRRERFSDMFSTICLYMKIWIILQVCGCFLCFAVHDLSYACASKCAGHWWNIASPFKNKSQGVVKMSDWGNTENVWILLDFAPMGICMKRPYSLTLAVICYLFNNYSYSYSIHLFPANLGASAHILDICILRHSAQLNGSSASISSPKRW